MKYKNIMEAKPANEGSQYDVLFRKAICESSVHSVDFDKAKYEWVRAGGNPNGVDKKDKTGQSSQAYYKTYFIHKFKEPLVAHACICSHPIQQQCYIYNKLNKLNLVVGNCCINRLLPNNKKSCEVCDEPHRRRTANICSTCDKESQNVMTIGKHAGRSLMYMFIKHPLYLVWIYDNMSHIPHNMYPFLQRCVKPIKQKLAQDIDVDCNVKTDKLPTNCINNFFNK